MTAVTTELGPSVGMAHPLPNDQNLRQSAYLSVFSSRLTTLVAGTPTTPGRTLSNRPFVMDCTRYSSSRLELTRDIFFRVIPRRWTTSRETVDALTVLSETIARKCRAASWLKVGHAFLRTQSEYECS